MSIQPLFITEKKFFYITFIGSILWIALYSYLMVWWATKTGKIFGIPDVVSDTFHIFTNLSYLDKTLHNLTNPLPLTKPSIP